MSVEQTSLIAYSPARYHVHPLVVMSILDHYKRRNESQECVMGTLLGHARPDGVVDITNCFPVPHAEGKDQVIVDGEYHASMLDLFQQINPSEEVIGWYSTGSEIVYTSSCVHDVYVRQVEGEPVLLTVDTTLKKSRLSLKAFTSRSFKLGDSPVIAVFDEVPLEFVASPEEKVGMDALIQSVPDDDAFDSSATLLSDGQGLTQSLESLHGLLSDMCDFVDAVQDGNVQPEPEIARAIVEAASRCPAVDSIKFDESFNDCINELLSISYLVNIAQAQVGLADKINSVF